MLLGSIRRIGAILSEPSAVLLELFTGGFMVSVRYLNAFGPRLCRRIGAILFEPSAVLLGLFTGRFMVSVRYLSGMGLD